jgi:two-component system nitrogen regulation response regulator GlnG
LSIPPLRERVEDLPLLVEHFLKRGAREMAVGSKSLSPEAMDALKRYPWPGNVRELENTLKSLMITNVSNFISLDSFPGHLMKKGKPVQESGNLEEWIEDKIAPLVREGITKNTDSLMQEVLHKVERPLLKLLLEETGWNQQKTSKLLGINRNTLRKKIETLRIRRKVVLDA